MEPRLPGFPTVWEPYTAEPLVDLAARRCLHYLSQLAEPDLPIPAPLCERLLVLAAEEGPAGEPWLLCRVLTGAHRPLRAFIPRIGGMCVDLEVMSSEGSNWWGPRVCFGRPWFIC